MAKGDIHLKGFSIVSANMRVNVHLKGTNEKLQKAQWALDTQVMTDMMPLMPKNTGTFISETQARSAAMAGTGWVCAAAGPMGRYLYYGKVMVDKDTGKGPMKIPSGPGEYVLRYREGAKLVATKRPLTYSNPKAVPEWFQAAKEKNMDKWLKKVKDKIGGR